MFAFRPSIPKRSIAHIYTVQRCSLSSEAPKEKTKKKDKKDKSISTVRSSMPHTVPEHKNASTRLKIDRRTIILSNGATYHTRIVHPSPQIFLLTDPSKHPAWKKVLDADEINKNRYIAQFRKKFGWTVAGMDADVNNNK